MYRNRLFTKLFTAAALIALCLLVSRTGARAATVTGAVGPYSGVTGEVFNPELMLWDNGEDVQIDDATKLTVSCDLYIPYYLFENTADKAEISIEPTLNLAHRSMETGGLVYDITFTKLDMGIHDGEAPVWWHYSEKEDKADIKPSYAALETVGDFVKVTITDMPVEGERLVGHGVFPIDDEPEWSDIEVSEVPSNTYSFALLYRVYSQGAEGTGSYLVTNVVLKEDGKTFFISDYSKKDKQIGELRIDPENMEEGPAVFAETVNTKAVSAKQKITLKKGKSTKIAVTPLFADDKVSASTSKKSVATASVKNGKVVIKGKKKGNAIVTITAGGVKTDIRIKVK